MVERAILFVHFKNVIPNQTCITVNLFNMKVNLTSLQPSYDSSVNTSMYEKLEME